MMWRHVSGLAVPAALLCAVACGSGGAMPSRTTPGPGDSSADDAASPATDDTTDAGLVFLAQDASSTVPLGVPVPTTFVSGQFGGYALGDPVTDTTPVGAGSSSADGGAGCDVL